MPPKQTARQIAATKQAKAARLGAEIVNQQRAMLLKYLVVLNTPEEVAACIDSYTAALPNKPSLQLLRPESMTDLAVNRPNNLKQDTVLVHTNVKKGDGSYKEAPITSYGLLDIGISPFRDKPVRDLQGSCRNGNNANLGGAFINMTFKMPRAADAKFDEHTRHTAAAYDKVIDMFAWATVVSQSRESGETVADSEEESDDLQYSMRTDISKILEVTKDHLKFRTSIKAFARSFIVEKAFLGIKKDNCGPLNLNMFKNWSEETLIPGEPVLKKEGFQFNGPLLIVDIPKPAKNSPTASLVGVVDDVKGTYDESKKKGDKSNACTLWVCPSKITGTVTANAWDRRIMTQDMLFEVRAMHRLAFFTSTADPHSNLYVEVVQVKPIARLSADLMTLIKGDTEGPKTPEIKQESQIIHASTSGAAPASTPSPSKKAKTDFERPDWADYSDDE
ncbi:hypothetical protein P7C70_g3506, partial [Phenoliferia sp. Uapishka_3]